MTKHKYFCGVVFLTLSGLWEQASFAAKKSEKKPGSAAVKVEKKAAKQVDKAKKKAIKVKKRSAKALRKVEKARLRRVQEKQRKLLKKEAELAQVARARAEARQKLILARTRKITTGPEERASMLSPDQVEELVTYWNKGHMRLRESADERLKRIVTRHTGLINEEKQLQQALRQLLENDRKSVEKVAACQKELAAKQQQAIALRMATTKLPRQRKQKIEEIKTERAALKAKIAQERLLRKACVVQQNQLNKRLREVNRKLLHQKKLAETKQLLVDLLLIAPQERKIAALQKELVQLSRLFDHLDGELDSSAYKRLAKLFARLYALHSTHKSKQLDASSQPFTVEEAAQWAKKLQHTWAHADEIGSTQFVQLLALLQRTVAIDKAQQTKASQAIPSASEEATEQTATEKKIADTIKYWAPDLAHGVVFRVQVATVKNFGLKKLIRSDAPYYINSLLYHEHSKKRDTYMLGGFRQYAEARRFMQALSKIGMKGVYVRAFQDNQPVSLAAARKKEKTTQTNVASEDHRGLPQEQTVFVVQLTTTAASGQHPSKKLLYQGKQGDVYHCVLGHFQARSAAEYFVQQLEKLNVPKDYLPIYAFKAGKPLK